MNSIKSADLVLQRLKQIFLVESDAELAQKLGVNRVTISTWRQRNSVPYSNCIQIAEEKGVSLDWLLLGKEDSPIEAKNDALIGQDKAAFDYYLALRPEQRREISAVIQEKKRMNELESRLDQLQRKVG